MDSSSTSKRSLHIIVFPWLAFGHLLPFLELSKAIAIRGHRITFISSPRNIQRLPELPPRISNLITFLSFPLPEIAGLPNGAEATSDLLPSAVQYLKQAFDGLEHPFTGYLESASPKPDWIIHDFCHYWLPSIASKFEVPCAFFAIGFPVFVASLLDWMYADAESPITPERLTEPPTKIKCLTKVACRPHEARQAIAYFFGTNNKSQISDVDRFTLSLRGCQVIAVRSCSEFESEWLDLLRDLCKIPVIPVGVLLPEEAQQKDGADDIIQWLDEQKDKSVVYVAFGSEAVLEDHLLHELAHGIELSELPFLWALRIPAEKASNSKILPDGFEERTQRLGKVVKTWIPQIKILAHRSIGGFLTHGGSSSVFESLKFALPLILLPVTPDQALNARLMEEKKVGLEIRKNEFDGTFDREEVARKMKSVMVEEEGEKLRARAEEMRKIVVDEQRHERYLDEFVRYLNDRRIDRNED